MPRQYPYEAPVTLLYVLDVWYHSFSDQFLEHSRNFATMDCICLLWPETPAFLSLRRAYSRLEVFTIVCGRSHKVYHVTFTGYNWGIWSH